MTRRLRVAVLFGGRSGEHEISLSSASNVLKALSPDSYDVTPIGIDRAGKWLPPSESQKLLGGGTGTAGQDPGKALSELASDGRGPIDVVIPVVHGTYGEDGALQGFLEMAGLPYVGCGVLSSALAMDKVMSKRVFQEQGLPTVPYVWFRAGEWSPAMADRVAQTCGFPCFVKPANLGSSVGVSKAKTPADLEAAVQLAARYDTKVVVEWAVPDAREIECAVLGNNRPEASVPGEIIPSREFYDYAAKYLDGTSELIIPAELPDGMAGPLRELAVRAFAALDCSGMARVDFLLSRTTGELYLNEINTIPGFTSISMYPKLWAASGLPYDRLLDRLIELALERHQQRSRLSTALE